MEIETGIPFVARHRTPLRSDPKAGPEHYYDPLEQLWVSADSGEPLVMRHIGTARSALGGSQFGETMMTKTSEGVDQSEGRVDEDSDSSGARAAAPVLSASQFGETTLTESGEGTDQSERTAHV
jgi:hypothetical protein